jgi:hypothetical protein
MNAEWKSLFTELVACYEHGVAQMEAILKDCAAELEAFNQRLLTWEKKVSGHADNK